MVSDRTKKIAFVSVGVTALAFLTGFAFQFISRRNRARARNISSKKPTKIKPSPESEILHTAKKSKTEKTMEEMAENLKMEGNSNFDNRNYSKAYDLFSQAIEMCPAKKEYYGNRAIVALKMEQYARAIEDADKMISLDRDYRKGYNIKAAIKFEMKEFKEAMELYQKTMELTGLDAKVMRESAVSRKIEECRKELENSANKSSGVSDGEMKDTVKTRKEHIREEALSSIKSSCEESISSSSIEDKNDDDKTDSKEDDEKSESKDKDGDENDKSDDEKNKDGDEIAQPPQIDGTNYQPPKFSVQVSESIATKKTEEEIEKELYSDIQPVISKEVAALANSKDK